MEGDLEIFGSTQLILDDEKEKTTLPFDLHIEKEFLRPTELLFFDEKEQDFLKHLRGY